MNKKTAIIGATALVLGSLSIAFSSTPRNIAAPESRSGSARSGISGRQTPSEVAYGDSAAETSFGASSRPAQNAQVPNAAGSVSPETAAAPASGKLDLAAPPAALTRAKSAAMVTSTSPAAALQALAATSGASKTAPKKASIVSNPKTQAAVAKASKPQKLFSYVRMLNYSPHPLVEEFLRDKPLQLNGKNYHFTVTYNENWDVVNDDEGYLKKLGFEINIIENEKKVRTLKLPPVAVNPATMKKGQVIGLAEVAPYKFKISVDSVTATEKGVSELIFKFDMAG
ncbi:MAG: hypothetical protein HQM09_00260 [Candidatus Riflebacteria bacterium]|nr:hypothetical protein [Candidatus Riflebacteria bacterium]